MSSENITLDKSSYTIIEHDDCYQLRVLIDDSTHDEFFFYDFKDAEAAGEHWSDILEKDDDKAIYEFSPKNALI